MDLDLNEIERRGLRPEHESATFQLLAEKSRSDT
jgi:hypothetical protein